MLQDTHWGAGLIGYFPTYTIGNLMASQLWERIEADVPDVWERIEAGDFAALREWLRVNIHRHGRKLYPRELLAPRDRRGAARGAVRDVPARQARGRRAARARLKIRS